MTYPNDPVVTFQDSPSMATPLDASNLNEESAAIVQIQNFLPSLQLYIPFTAVQAASTVSAAANSYVLVSTASNNVTVDFPVAPANFTVVGVKMVTQGGTNMVTAQLGGSDHFDTTGGSQTATLKLLDSAGVWQYNATTSVWVKISDDMPLSQLDLRYVNSVTAADSSITVAGTTVAPTVKVAQANLTLAESQITGLVANLNQTNQGGGAWESNTYAWLMSNMKIDDAAGTVLMTSSTIRTVTILLGLAPAGSYSVFKLYVTNTPSSGSLTCGLYSASSLSSTSWSRLGSGNATATMAAGLVTTSLTFTLASPTYVLLEAVATSTFSSTYPSLAATVTSGVPAGLLNPISGNAAVTATSSNTTAPGATLNPNSGFTASAQKIWCALN